MPNFLAAFLAALFVFCGVDRAAATMSCTMTFSTVAFGSFDVLAGSEVDTTGTATVSCTGAAASTAYRFCSDVRPGPDAVGNQRNMWMSPSYLAGFNLYYDAAHLNAWGNYIQPYLGGGYQFDLTSNVSGQISGTVTVYAAAPSGQQTVVPGAYTEYMASVYNNLLQYGSTTSGGSCPVGGSTIQVSFYVTGTVITNCNVNGGTLNFGTTSYLTSNIDATATITVQCTNTTPYSLGIDNGANASASQRRVSAGGGNYVNYGLYTDAGRSNAWVGTTSSSNCTNGTSSCYLGTGAGSTQNVTVYGRVPPQPEPALGSYSDTVVVTLTY
jgi:spore coat protein U-like protein